MLFVTRLFVARRALIDALACRSMAGAADLWLQMAAQHPEAERALLRKAEQCERIAMQLGDHARAHAAIAVHGVAPDLVPAIPPGFGRAGLPP